MLEKDIEKAVCDYAKSKGCLVYKFTSPARRSVPDRLFIPPRRKVFFIEFKKPGGRLTKGQEREIANLEGQGVEVYIVNNIEAGKRLLDALI